MIRYTDAVTTWMPVGMDPGIEFFLRDSAFNRGPTGAAMILQIALGVKADGRVGQVTRGALASSEPKELLDKMRAAREKSMSIASAMSAANFGAIWSIAGTKPYSVAKELQGRT
jgi:lysozyme family protein